MCDADKGLRFTEFMDTDGGTEKLYFQPLQTIADRISSAKVDGRTRNKFNFRLCPESLIASDIPGSNNMTDACITLDDTKNTILTATGIAVVFEFKMKSDKAFENNKQVVSANVQIMNDDARRMFTFGVTIVKDEVTLWYHSRSHSAVSESFSFVQDPRMFIKVLMSFLFATEEELGYDPMVIRKPDGTYLFIMPGDGKPDRFFRTERSLSEYRSSNITGRMARVWQVGEYSSLEDTGEAKGSLVLKDVWLDASADAEKIIQDSIFEDIEKFFKSSHETDPMTMFDKTTFETLKTLVQNEGYKEYFLKIDADYVGKTSKPVAPGSKRKMGLFLSEVKPFVARLKKITQSSTRTPHGTPRPTAMETDLEVTIPRDFTPKRQYRVVFDEICRTVGDLETLGEVVDVLQETLVALQLMYCAGWVHRDISSGNILAHRKASGEWQAKLSDLEYARRYPPPSDYDGAADPKTGTPYFMPHEILNLKSLWISEQDEAIKVDPNAVTENQMSEIRASFTLDEHGPKTTVTRSAPNEVIIYNFQHDLESVWWILMWTLTARVLHKPSRDFAKTIFKNQTSLWNERADCITKDITESLTACLEPSLQPFALPLEILRWFMYSNYVVRTKEKKLFDLGWYRGIHIYFASFFRAVKRSEPSDWRAMRLDTNEPQPSAPAPQSPSQPGGTLQPAAAARNVPKPGRGKRPRKPDNADYEPSESETQSEELDSEDQRENENKKDTRSRKKARSAHAETGP